MSIQDFIKNLQDATNQQFWKNPPEKVTFQAVLDQYALYYESLSTAEEQEKLSTIFWDQVKAIGTPIIEEGSEGNCEVYFLFPRNKLSDSDEKPGEKKDLYLQGDFHGYDTTTGRQLLSHFKNTGIMLRSDTIPKDAIITYRYVQLEPSLRGRTPTEHHGSAIIEPVPESFFPQTEEVKEDKEEVIPGKTKNPSEQFWGKATQRVDECSTHRPVFFATDGSPGSPERIFRVSPEPSRARLPGEAVNWSMLLSTENSSNSNRRFVYHDTLYSDLNGDIVHDETTSGESATPDQLRTEPYLKFTRVIHVFKPTSEKIDNIVVVNDGIGYLLSGMMDRFETMDKLSPNTAFVFISCLPGLAKTVSALPPKADLPGMRERVVDYQLKIEVYVDFLKKLLSELDLKLPMDPSHRVMIGSSLVGTASLYIALNHPDLFGGVIVQSPSPFNRNILNDVVQQNDLSKPKAKIHFSCGEFEQPKYAANTNWPYSVELSQRLNLPLHPGAHGHQFVAWTFALEQSLPEIYFQLHALPRQSEDSGVGKHTFFAHKPTLPDLHQTTSQQEKENTTDDNQNDATQITPNK